MRQACGHRSARRPRHGRDLGPDQPVRKDINPINIGIYNEGLCPIVKNGKLGFIDKHGEIAIPCQFDRKLAWGTTFKDGLCIIQKDTSSCQGNVIIDKTGHVLQTIPRDYRATYLGEHIFLLETNNPSINFSSRKIITIVPLKWTNRSLKQLK